MWICIQNAPLLGNTRGFLSKPWGTTMTHEKDMSFVQGGNCELGAICQNRTIFHYKVPFLMEMKVIFLIPLKSLS